LKVGGYAATEVGDAAAPPAGAGATTAKVAVTSVATTETVTTADAMSATMAMPTVTPEMTAVPQVAAALQPPPEATPEPAAQAERSAASATEQPVTTTAVAPAAPTIDPLRVIELVLLGLVIVLGAAMLIVRRKQV
jgi:hypothetical protein